MDMHDLGDFLRHRREALTPEEAGLSPGAGHRRTPGLRREEVAWLASISTNYYERLEQARASRPSPEVLTSLSRALGLSERERLHLARLAGQVPLSHGESEEKVPDGVLRLLERLGSIPAYVLDARYDIVAFNDVAAALFPDLPLLPPERRNVLRPRTDRHDNSSGAFACGTLVGEENTFVRQAAADLREAAARYPADPELHQLIDDFAASHPDFPGEWVRHDVRAPTTLRKRVEHPELGELHLDCQTLQVPGYGYRIVMYTAEPGSLDQAKLDQMETGRNSAIDNRKAP